MGGAAPTEDDDGLGSTAAAAPVTAESPPIGGNSTSSPNAPDAADPVADAWSALLTRWQDDEAHRGFMGLCATLDRLPDAGQRYRQVRDADPDPERRKDAERHIARLLGIAIVALERTRTTPSPRPRRKLTWIAIAVSLTLVVAALWLATRLR